MDLLKEISLSFTSGKTLSFQFNIKYITIVQYISYIAGHIYTCRTSKNIV